MTDVLDRPAPPKGKARPKADAPETPTEDAIPTVPTLPTLPTFRKGDRVWFWHEGDGDGPNGLTCWAADVVGPADGFPDAYQVYVLNPGTPTFIPYAQAAAAPTNLTITPRD